MIGSVDQIQAMYRFQTQMPTSQIVVIAVQATAEDFSMLWHQRLGHLSFSKLFLFNNLLPVNVIPKAIFRDVCPLAKQCRLSFPTSSIKTSGNFYKIHVNISGPYCVQSIGNFSSLLTIVDSFSRFTWVFLMRNKLEVSILIKSFHNLVFTWFNSIIKWAQSDNLLNSTCEFVFLPMAFCITHLVSKHHNKKSNGKETSTFA